MEPGGHSAGGQRVVHESMPRGSKRWIARRFTGGNGKSFRVSMGVVRGLRDGPVFANVAGQHGMEHVGPAVLRNVFDQIDPRKLAGVLYVCPGANPLALENDFEIYPEHLKHGLTAGIRSIRDLGARTRQGLGRYNMNRLWGDDIGAAPAADPAGGVAQEVVGWLWRTMIAPAQVVIDHHCVAQTMSPYVFCEDPVIAWTPFLGLPGVWSTGPLPKPPTPYAWRRLALQSIRHGKIGMVIEYSHQHTIEERDIPIGMFAVTNMMKALGMLPGQAVIRRPVWAIKGPYFNHLRQLQSRRVGHVHFLADEYTVVRRGQAVAEIRDLQTNRVVQRLSAPCRSLMLHHNPAAVIRCGEVVCRMTPDFRLLARPGKRYRVPGLRV